MKIYLACRKFYKAELKGYYVWFIDGENWQRVEVRAEDIGFFMSEYPVENCKFENGELISTIDIPIDQYPIETPLGYADDSWNEAHLVAHILNAFYDDVAMPMCAALHLTKIYVVDFVEVDDDVECADRV